MGVFYIEGGCDANTDRCTVRSSSSQDHVILANDVISDVNILNHVALHRSIRSNTTTWLPTVVISIWCPSMQRFTSRLDVHLKFI